MAVQSLSTRAMKERQVSNRRKHSSGVSGLSSCVRGRRAKSRVTSILICLGLVAVTWAVFGQTLAHDFVNFDDHVYVYENPLVVRGLSIEGIIGAFTHTHALNWHPLTTLSHMLDCQLYGLKRRRPSPHQRHSSYNLGAVALSGAQANDRCALAKRLCGRALRHSSVARRIRRMGGGAEGCAQCACSSC